jgi:hypothetical protein
MRSRAPRAFAEWLGSCFGVEAVAALKHKRDAWHGIAVWQLTVGTTQDYTAGAGPVRPFSAA